MRKRRYISRRDVELHLRNGNRLTLRLDCETMLLGLMVEPSRTGFVATMLRLRPEVTVSSLLQTASNASWLGA